LCPSNEADHHSSGFTLIEALVALTIVAIALSSIGALIASTVKGTHAAEARIGRLNAAKTVLATLPDRDRLVPGSFSGRVDGYGWRVDVVPAGVAPKEVSWLPHNIVVTVRGPDGADIEVRTVRLGRRESK
jgi:general secretion pathway protein I